MTSENSSIKPPVKRAPFAPLFRFTLKQKWTTGLLISIIMFFTVPIPVIMRISSRLRNGGQDVLKRALEDMLEWSEAIRYVLIPLTSVLAVVMTCAMLSYLKNKVTVDFYHSLPVKRGRLYANQLLAGYVLLILPLVLMLAVTAAVCAFNGVLSAAIVTNMLKALGETVVYSLLFYGLGTLVGMVCGLTGVQLVLTCVTVFIIPLIYLVSVFFIDIFNENMWTDWYCRFDIFSRLTPALRFAFNENPLSVIEAVVFLLAAAALFIGGYFVYLHRKSERAGTSVVFNPLGEVIKYLLIFPMTLLGGLLFYWIMDSFLWTVFGMVCGGLLTFMLANTILQKTAKAMFRGWKTLCVYGGVVVICMIMLMTNLFGVNSGVPSAGMISSVEFQVEGATELFSFRDKDVIAALRKIYTEGDWINPYSYTDYSTDYNYEYDETYRQSSYLAGRMDFNIVFHPVIGAPAAKSVTIYNKNEFADELRVILDSEEFKTQYAKLLDGCRGSGLVDNSSYLSYKDGNVYRGYMESILGYDEYDVKATEAVKLDIQNTGFDYFQQPSAGYVRLSIPNKSYFGTYVSVPLFMTSENFGKLYYESKRTNTPPDKQLEAFAECVDSITVADIATGEKHVYTKPEQILDIVSNFSGLYSFDYWNSSPFTLFDSKYVITYKLAIRDFYTDKPVDGDDNNQLYESYFLFGRTPDFVSASFAK